MRERREEGGREAGQQAREREGKRGEERKSGGRGKENNRVGKCKLMKWILDIFKRYDGMQCDMG